MIFEDDCLLTDVGRDKKFNLLNDLRHYNFTSKRMGTKLFCFTSLTLFTP